MMRGNGRASTEHDETGDNAVRITQKHIIDLHAIGERLEFNEARERTGGERSEGIVTLGPGRMGPDAHIHTQQAEGFEVLSGTLVVEAGGRSVTLRSGESFVVASGERHTFRNGDAHTPVVASFWFEPALRTEWMLQSMGEWAMERGGDWKHVPLLPAAYMLFLMRKEYRLAGMPFWVQDVLFGALAGVAILTGQARRVQRPADGISSAGGQPMGEDK
jgi:mannose-6-phosphate isomerase-like protein (cupin superfamily)